MAKDYTTEEYLAYAKYILEGDSSAVVSDENEGGDIDSQFKKLIGGAALTGTGAVACLVYMNKKFGIKDWNGLSNFFKQLCTRIGNGRFGKVLAGIGGGVSAALLWANKLVRPMSDKLGKMIGGKAGALAGKPISVTKGFFSSTASPYTYGSCICMATIASAVIAVLYKIYKVIKDKISEGETKDAYYARLHEGVNRAIIESKAMFSDLNQYTEGLFGASKKVPETFIQKMQSKATEMWGWINNAAKANKVLAIMIAVCTACVFCWVGMKKYVASHPELESEPTSESVSVAKKSNKGASSGKKLASKPKKAVKSVKAKSNINAAVKKASKKK